MLPFLREGDQMAVAPVAWEDIRVGDILTYRFLERYPTRRVTRFVATSWCSRGTAFRAPRVRGGARRRARPSRGTVARRGLVSTQRLGLATSHPTVPWPGYGFAATGQLSMDRAGLADFPELSRLRVGSLSIQLECPDPGIRSRLERLFRTRVEAVDGRCQLELAVLRSAEGPFGSSDRLEMQTRQDTLVISSDAIFAELTPGEPARAWLCVHPVARELDHYLLVVLNSILRRLGAVRLHAAALRWRERTHLFVGSKGQAKPL